MKSIIKYINDFHGKDLSVYNIPFIKSIIDQRITDTLTKNQSGYLSLLMSNRAEQEKLLNSLNNSYSLFFRNPIDFYILERFILPEIYHKYKNTCSSVRIWSAACADGQEPYSVAMLTQNLTKTNYPGSKTMILGTDLSSQAITRCREGKYSENVVQNVKQSYISSCFSRSGNLFSVNEHLKDNVEFAQYDLLDSNTTSPPSGIFGGYDIVFCCNLLIYYRPDVQKFILRKIFNSINNRGFLVVDESERSVIKSDMGFRLYNNLGNIFVRS